MKLEPHFYAALAACDSACALLEALPSTDLVDSMRDLIYTQHELFMHMIEQRHFGSDALEEFVRRTINIKDEVARLKDDI